jgi:hypothetical protein
VPNSNITVPTAGKWRIKIEATIFINVSASGNVRPQFAFATSTTPNTGVIHNFRGPQVYDSAEVQTLDYESEPLEFSGGETLYIHALAREWSGGATISDFRTRAVDAGYGTKLKLIKVG